MDPVTGIKYTKACDQLGPIKEFMGSYPTNILQFETL